MDLATPKWLASKSISARLACPFRAASRTAARYSLSLIFVIVTDLELGCTVTEIRRAMADYIGHNAASINDWLDTLWDSVVLAGLFSHQLKKLLIGFEKVGRSDNAAHYAVILDDR